MHLLWVPLSLGAGLCQSARNGLARSIASKVSPALNSWSRFAFNLPFSTVLVGVLIALKGFPELSPRYLILCLGTGLTQLLGNVALIAAFRRTSFARAIVLHKLEIVFTAIIGATLFSEVPTALGWTGIVVCAAGVVLMQRAKLRHQQSLPDSRGRAEASGALLAIFAGLCLVFASFWLKEANQELVALNPRVGAGRFEVAGHTLFHVTWMEVLILTTWLKLRMPGELSLVSIHWRRMALIGFAGFVGSLGWFWAYSLTLVAYVKAVGQIEAVAAVFLSLWLWKERDVVSQIPGIVLVLAGIVLVLLG